METNNGNLSDYNKDMYNNYKDEEELYSINRYNNRRYDRRLDRRYDRWDDNRYYNYPDCDRTGRCRNPMWWMFWPFFFF
jgi:hypothetical protein